jgi:hypothetical protein
LSNRSLVKEWARMKATSEKERYTSHKYSGSRKNTVREKEMELKKFQLNKVQKERS